MRGTALPKQLNHVVQIGIASAEASGEPISTAPGNLLAVGNYVKLTSLSRANHGYDAEALVYEGHETRDLGFVVLSGRAGNDFDLHSVLELVRWPTYRSAYSCRLASSVNERYRDFSPTMFGAQAPFHSAHNPVRCLEIWASGLRVLIVPVL